MTLWVFRKAQTRQPEWGWIFPIANLVVALEVLFARQCFAPLIVEPSQAWDLLGNQISFAGLMFAVSFFTQQTLGVATQKLEFENMRANKALADLEKQQQLLIYSQEQLRKELATYLHDGLQSNLVVLGLQMKQASEGLPEQYRGIGNSFIEEIERMRRVDVRTAIRQLSPDLESLPLKSALQELSKRFDKVMKTNLDLQSQSEINSLSLTIKLGAYRIIEQALLNALMHGQAQNTFVLIRIEGSELILEVSNDGDPIAEDWVPGSGFATIDAWTKSLSGSFSVFATEDGSTLRAKLST